MDQEEKDIFTLGLKVYQAEYLSSILILGLRILPISKTTHGIRYPKKIGRVSHLAGQFQFNTGIDLSNIQYLKVLNCLAVLHWCLDTAALIKSSQKTRDKMGHIRPQSYALYAKKYTGLKKTHYHG